MPIPNTIERSVDVPVSPDEAWRAFGTADGLASWFGQRAHGGTIAPGDVVAMEWDVDGTTYRGALEVKVVEKPHRFAFTWAVTGLPADDPRRTYVDFTIVAHGSGSRITVLESGFAQLPDAMLGEAYEGNIEGWAHELRELARYLGGDG